MLPPSLRGFTLIELLLVIFLVALLCSLVLPGLARAKEQARRVKCICNLKQVGLALKIYALDHESNYPWHTATNDGGTYGSLAAAGWRNFSAASNELVTPQILSCPSDAVTKKNTMSWEELSRVTLRGNALSFFIGLDGFEQTPNVMLAGDRNFTGGRADRCGSVSDPPGIRASEYRAANPLTAWTNGVHGLKGNIALTDGSVQRANTRDLREIVDASYRTLTNGSLLSARGHRLSNHILPPR